MAYETKPTGTPGNYGVVRKKSSLGWLLAIGAIVAAILVFWGLGNAKHNSDAYRGTTTGAGRRPLNDNTVRPDTRFDRASPMAPVETVPPANTLPPAEALPPSNDTSGTTGTTGTDTPRNLNDTTPPADTTTRP